MIKKESDKQKAKSLVNMAEITLERLKETNFEKYPTNILTDYYDIIRKLMEALISLNGVRLDGEGKHQKIIDYICNEYKLGESIRLFIQELRYYRNRISYEGFMVKYEYIKTNKEKIEKIINSLLSLINKKLY